MWFVGALIGAILVAAIAPRFWLLGALIGAVVAKFVNRYAALPPASSDGVLQRLQRLEDEVA
ncbi:MAG TPA: hypothetical protein VF801_12815, partial [Rhodocyclaceae bacterium]